MDDSFSTKNDSLDINPESLRKAAFVVAYTSLFYSLTMFIILFISLRITWKYSTGFRDKNGKEYNENFVSDEQKWIVLSLNIICLSLISDILLAIGVHMKQINLLQTWLVFKVIFIIVHFVTNLYDIFKIINHWEKVKGLINILHFILWQSLSIFFCHIVLRYSLELKR